MNSLTAIIDTIVNNGIQNNNQHHDIFPGDDTRMSS